MRMMRTVMICAYVTHRTSTTTKDTKEYGARDVTNV